MKADLDIPRAPAGWGYLPGAPFRLKQISRDQLPELPLLRLVPKERQKAVIAQALADFEHLPQVTPAMVKTRYGVHSTSAAMALDMARLRKWQ